MAFWPVFLLITSSHSLFLSQMFCIRLDETDVTENKNRPFPRFFRAEEEFLALWLIKIWDQSNLRAARKASTAHKRRLKLTEKLSTQATISVTLLEYCRYIRVPPPSSPPPPSPTLEGYTQPARRYDTLVNLFI